MKRWQKVLAGAGLIFLGLLAAGGLALAGLRSWLYPLAPPMPAVVSEPMPAILARLEGLLKTNAPHVAALLQPGLSAGDIERLQAQCHVQLPEDLRLIYQWHNGSRFTTNFVSKDFLPGERFLPLEEALADRAAIASAKTTWAQRMAWWALAQHSDTWLCLFSDEGGDGYWYDPARTPAQGSVFYHDNEEGAYVFFPSPKNLMAGVVRGYEQGAFHLKTGATPPELEEDYGQSEKIWGEFGAVRE